MVEIITTPNIQCLSYETIIANGGSVVENLDGSVSVYSRNIFNALAPVILTKPCCELIKNTYFFDIETQTCRWTSSGNTSACGIANAFKLVLNPNGNDGTLFNLDDNDNCSLNVEFDYLFKFKCEDLVEIFNASSIISAENAALLAQIVALQLEISEKTVSCEQLTTNINELVLQISNTSYSISCPLQPQVPLYNEITPLTGNTFTNTGFIPYGFYMLDVQQYTPLIYCLTDPDGLAAWAEILGPTRYQQFLAGDSNSYTCDDVQALVALNQANIEYNLIAAIKRPILLNVCDTPFGTKTTLINQLNTLTQLKTDCQIALDALNAQLILLQGGLNSGTTGTTICPSPVSVFENLDISVTIDVITSANTLDSVFEFPLLPSIGFGNLYSYLTANPNSGFYLCGDPTINESGFTDCSPISLNISGLSEPNVFTCDSIMNNIIQDLFIESGLSGTTNGLQTFSNNILKNALASQWLHYSTVINDVDILKEIANKKIKLSFKVNSVCSDFCLLVDEIVLDKVCTNIDTNSIFISKSPGFELNRVVDNKKSWIANTTRENRNFNISTNADLNPIRRTNYDVNDERLVINTKEIDLDISIASAIENDVWCYIVDNPCLLTGTTSCNPCATGTTCCGDNKIDFSVLTTQPLSAVTTIEEFEYYLMSELIDVKSRQTLSGYPTLRALYDRYVSSPLYCSTTSSAFNYLTMDAFANLVGNYWVDIVEQVIPATTIWGSVKVYSNTIFDQQKFKYKSYSTLFCGNKFSGETVPSPISGTTGYMTNVSVSMTPLIPKELLGLSPKSPVTITCNSIAIAQMNMGSEFIGSVSIIGSPNCDVNNGGGFTAINECTLQASVTTSYPTASLTLIGAETPVTYLWSNGQTGSTMTVTTGGTYSVSVTDANCCNVIKEFTMTP